MTQGTSQEKNILIFKNSAESYDLLAKKLLKRMRSLYLRYNGLFLLNLYNLIVGTAVQFNP